VGQLGYIPTDDDKPEISWESLLFKVESISEKRIATVIVVRSIEEIEDE
jgi:hypothetical protein